MFIHPDALDEELKQVQAALAALNDTEPDRGSEVSVPKAERDRQGDVVNLAQEFHKTGQGALPSAVAHPARGRDEGVPSDKVDLTSKVMGAVARLSHLEPTAVSSQATLETQGAARTLGTPVSVPSKGTSTSSE